MLGRDGAANTWRRLRVIALDDLDFDEPWRVLEGLVDALGLAKLPATCVQRCYATASA